MYKNDLAYIQHQGFSEFARASSPGVLTILRRAGITEGHVLDLGCGNGTWLKSLTRGGFSATGIDQSRSLVSYAREAAPKATVKVGSVHQIAFPRCDAITALGEVLSYLPEDKAAPMSLRRLFHRAHIALRPGGLFVFDLLVSGRRMEYSTWREGQSWAVLTRVHEQPRRLTRDIVTFRKIRGRYRRAEERHVLSVAARRSVLADLRWAGFVARTAHRYGTFQLPARRLVFIGRKPKAA
jgi:SAM-dependent methyltransferase